MDEFTSLISLPSDEGDVTVPLDFERPGDPSITGGARCIIS
uniref:Putative pheromone n=1 Tax=Flammulina velutipes TaxID=38945 RepID=A0A1B2U706_FLAVE|nr:putative pheromone precursor [Flammulina velutipes]